MGASRVELAVGGKRQVKQIVSDLSVIAGSFGLATLFATCLSLYFFIPTTTQSIADSILYRLLLAGSQIVTFAVVGFVLKGPSRLEMRSAFASFWVGPASLLCLVIAPDELKIVTCIMLVLEGVCLSQLLVTWFWYLCDHPKLSAEFCLAAAFFVAILLVMLLSIFPDQVRGIIMTVFWLVSSICISFLHRGSSDMEKLNAQFDKKKDWSNHIKPSSTIMLGVQYFLLGYGAGYASWQDDAFGLVILVIPLAITVVMIVDGLSLRKITERSVSRFTPGIAISALMLLFLLYQNNLGAAFCFSLLLAVAVLYIIFGWAALVRRVVYSSLYNIRVLARARALDYTGLLLGLMVGTIASASLGLDSQVTLVISVVIGIGYAIVSSVFHVPNFPEGSSERERETEAPDNKGQWRKRCSILSEKYHLTNRQYDVLLLISQGRDAEHTAEALSISVSTVQTHIRNIYQKTGVHSRQELLDLIEQTKLNDEA